MLREAASRSVARRIPLSPRRKGRAALHAWFLLLTVAGPATAAAHFQNFLSRIVHVTSSNSDLVVFVQIPFALTVVPVDWDGKDLSAPIPFVRRRVDSEGAEQLYLDSRALLERPDVFFMRLAQSIRRLPPPPARAEYGAAEIGEVRAAVIESINDRDPFTYLPQLMDGLGRVRGLKLTDDTDATLLSDAVVSYTLVYHHVSLSQAGSLVSNRKEWAPISERAINIVMLYGDSGKQTRTSIGRLSVDLDRGPSASTNDAAAPAFVSYLRAGFHHVLVGIDHVLFILIIAISSTHWRQFMSNSAAFTVGHSITLLIGARGYFSGITWFVPCIETCIALSIVFAGWRVLACRDRGLLAAAVFAIGLLHGFGFSFALDQLAMRRSISFAGLILGFNSGIELAQLAIYVVAAPVLWMLSRYWPSDRLRYQTLLTVPCIAIAFVWAAERAVVLIQRLGGSIFA